MGIWVFGGLCDYRLGFLALAKSLTNQNSKHGENRCKIASLGG